MIRLIAFLLVSLFFVPAGRAQMPVILPLQEQAAVQNAWLQERVRTVLPDLMRRTDIDMWILISREYNEDPVLETLLPATWLSARRTTMLVVYDTGDSLETLACARYDVGDVFRKAWDKEQEPDQWKRLRDIVEERSPRRIGINRSEHFGLADGLSAYHYEKLKTALGPAYGDRLVSAEELAIGWLETRTESEMAVYRQICRIAHAIIREGLSEAVIQPGITTTEDVVWFYRERIRALGLETWFHPSVDIQRADPGHEEQRRSFSQRPDESVIRPGDLVHVDFGIAYLGLHTDTQENAYILKPGEHAAPPYLVEAFGKGLRLMDLLTEQFAAGRSGNDILASARGRAIAEGLRPSIYTHPIGYHGHGAGPTIGLWDQQEGVPVRGDYPLYAHTAYSIELNTTVRIPEWNKDVRIMMEEDAFFDGRSVRYIDGRQTKLYLVPRPSPHLGEAGDSSSGEAASN